MSGTPDPRRARFKRGVLAVLMVRLCRAAAASQDICDGFHAVVAEALAGLSGGQREHMRRRLVREADTFEAAYGRATEMRFAAALRMLITEVLRDAAMSGAGADAFRRGADLLDEVLENSELDQHSDTVEQLRAWLDARGLFGRNEPELA